MIKPFCFHIRSRIVPFFKYLGAGVFSKNSTDSMIYENLVHKKYAAASAPMTIPSDPKIDPNLNRRLHQLAATLSQSPEAILREAITQYLEREENPSEKKYPPRHPVGGIITPV